MLQEHKYNLNRFYSCGNYTSFKPNSCIDILIYNQGLENKFVTFSEINGSNQSYRYNTFVVQNVLQAGYGKLFIMEFLRFLAKKMDSEFKLAICTSFHFSPKLKFDILHIFLTHVTCKSTSS